MLRILIQPREIWLEATEGGSRLLDLVDEQAGAGIPLSCRGARCGICQLEVVRGAECFEPPERAERETLAALRARAGARLGCQLRLTRHASGEAELRLSAAPAGDW